MLSATAAALRYIHANHCECVEKGLVACRNMLQVQLGLKTYMALGRSLTAAAILGASDTCRDGLPNEVPVRECLALATKAATE
jgi:hypothetical protein